MRASARLAIAAVMAVLGTSLLAGTGAAQLPELPELPIDLPSLTPDLLLDIAKVEPPPEGVTLQIHADFPEEAPFLLDGVEIYALTANITPEGELILGSTQSAETASTDSEGTPECSDDAFLPTGHEWDAHDMPIRWHMNRRSIPAGIDKDRTVLEIRRAHRIWTDALSRCTDSDQVSFEFQYGGRTGKHPAFDDVNSVDFGSLGNGALALNYVWFSGTDIFEVDLRFNKVDYNWTNVAGVKRYQVKNVAAHELGHQFGLDDLGDPHGALTMYGRITKGERKKISLGRGDLRGAEILSSQFTQ